MHTRRLFSILVLALALVSLLYWWQASRNDLNQSAPNDSDPPAIAGLVDVPLSSPAIADSSEWGRRLAARRGAKDLQATVETFKESGNCLEYFVARDQIASIKKDESLNDLGKETLETLDIIDANLKSLSSVLEQTQAFCSGANQDSVARAYMASLLEAAQMDDADALSCFVISGAQIPSPEAMRSGRYSKYLEERYLRHAPDFTQRALERNDPYVAAKSLRRYVSSPPVHPSRLDNLPLPDAYQTWRAARLATLRALPEQRASLEDNLVIFEKLNLLSPKDIKRADDWAKATYEHGFLDEPKLDLNRFGSCNSLESASS